MAIVKLGEIVVGVRGTAGGLTFSANASGPFARIWSAGSNPRTAYQQTVRAAITRYGAEWAAMSEPDRDAWDAFGQTPPEDDTNSLGETIYLTGWQWFVRIQQRRAAVGLDIDTTLPSDVAVTPPASVTLSLEELPGGTCEISWPGGTFPPDYAAIATLTFHPSGALRQAARNYKQILALIDPDNTTEDITTAIATRFGAIRAGWFGFATLQKQRPDAVRSTPVTTRQQVV